MRAYITVTVGPGKAREVAKGVASLPGVKMANACWGEPDVFAVVEVADEKTLTKLVTEKIQKLEGVASTNTHIAIESMS